MTEQRHNRGYGTAAGLFGVLAVIFLKFKVAILAALKAVPLLKLGWLLKGSWTMIFSLGLYTMMFGWRYAVTLVGLIYIHEMGHYIFMKANGLNPKAPVFVPFLGAYVAMTNLPRDPVLHAWVAYAGPLVGGLGAVALYWLGIQSGNVYLIAAANTGFILNLLQLVPVRPFDGGFISACISKWLSVPGIILLVLTALCFHSVLLLVISAFAGFSMVSRWHDPDPGALVSGGQRFLVTLAYFGLAACLAWMYWLSEGQLIGVSG